MYVYSTFITETESTMPWPLEEEVIEGFCNCQFIDDQEKGKLFYIEMQRMVTPNLRSIPVYKI